jgi:hypothetical protein
MMHFVVSIIATKDSFLRVPPPLSHNPVKISYTYNNDANKALEALANHTGIAAKHGKQAARKLLRQQVSPSPSPPSRQHYHFNFNFTNITLASTSPSDQDYIDLYNDPPLSWTLDKENSARLKSLLTVYNDGSVTLDFMSHAGADVHLQESIAEGEIFIGSDYGWPGLLNRMPSNFTCTIIPGTKAENQPIILSMNADELVLQQLLEVTKQGLLNLNSPDVCNQTSPNFLIKQMENAVIKASSDQKHWHTVIRDIALIVVFSLVGFCCMIVGTDEDGLYESNGVKLFKCTLDGIIYLGVVGTSLIITINDTFKTIIRTNAVAPIPPRINQVVPFADSEDVPVNLQEGEGGSKKTTKNYKKTTEKYGKRCVYLSKRNAKYLKINGNFVAYKTAVKMLNKK